MTSLCACLAAACAVSEHRAAALQAFLGEVMASFFFLSESLLCCSLSDRASPVSACAESVLPRRRAVWLSHRQAVRPACLPRAALRVRLVPGQCSCVQCLAAVQCDIHSLWSRGWGKLGPLAVPLAICLLMWLVGPISSMCINPARAFGPAVVTG